MQDTGNGTFFISSISGHNRGGGYPRQARGGSGGRDRGHAGRERRGGEGMNDLRKKTSAKINTPPPPPQLVATDKNHTRGKKLNPPLTCGATVPACTFSLQDPTRGRGKINNLYLSKPRHQKWTAPPPSPLTCD